ncbi:hypothetical protein ACFFX0_22665 [Citricoccus parietis]|uniref:Uncharacterized protein n=1 Tax=Citricoccus parietis TaxID=592307 RepID=A0ABV5G4I4_9MICC
MAVSLLPQPAALGYKKPRSTQRRPRTRRKTSCATSKVPRVGFRVAKGCAAGVDQTNAPPR